MTLSLGGAAPAGAQVASTGFTTGTRHVGDQCRRVQLDADRGTGPGVYTILIKATNTNGLSTTESFKVTVNEVDTPPVFDPVAPVTVQTGTTAQIQVVAHDADIPVHNLSTVSILAPQGARSDPQTGLITWNVPASLAAGTTNIPVRVTEIGGARLERDTVSRRDRTTWD